MIYEHASVWKTTNDNLSRRYIKKKNNPYTELYEFIEGKVIEGPALKDLDGESL